ncbi:hypothetical protein Bbelb_153350 [Branchiostoma belcheri]|nr:hypothetical protein Bbelb_153350 [Branchiostoma belcheri]
MEKVEKFFETEEGRTVLVALERFVRGSATGLALYGGGTVAMSVLNGKLFSSPGHVFREALSVDTLRFSAFLGAFPAVYKLAHDTLRRARPGKDGSNSTIAGAIAGLTMFIESGKRRRTIALFLLARAANAFFSTLVRRGHVPRVRHCDTAVFCLCTGFIVYAAALDPELLPVGYYRSILRWSRGWTDKGLAHTLRRTGTEFVPCDLHMHPGSCHAYTLKDTLRSWPSFFKMYLPINLVPVLLFKYKQLLSRPTDTLTSLFIHTVWSGTFLTFLVQIAKYVICVLRHRAHKPPPVDGYIPFTAGVLCALSVLFERASRRRELSMYVIPHFLNGMFLLAQRHHVKTVPFGSILVFMASTMTLMHAYERERDSLSNLVKGILKYLVGN